MNTLLRILLTPLAIWNLVQSVLLKTLLQGVNVRDVMLRAYRDLSHMECLTALCGSRTSKYSSMIAGEIVNLVAKGEGWV